MAFLPGSTTVIIRGRWQAPDGSPARGDVELTLEAPYADSTANVTYTQEKRKYTLDANGEISVPYIITGTFNQLGALSGTKVKIRENFEDTKSYTWQTAFTAANITDTDKIWLSDLSAVEARPLNQYVSLGSYNTDQNIVKTDIANLKTDVATRALKTYVDSADNLKAPIASPTFTGSPAAPTQTAGDNTTKLATTAFVTTADNLKAPIASPTFTGTPSAPTAATTTNTTQLATTAFAQAAINAGTAPLENPLGSGLYYVADYVNSTQTAIASGTFLGARTVCGRSGTLNSISVEVTVAGSAGALVRLGIYKVTNMATYASTLLVDAGTFDATVVGVKTATISVPFNAGDQLIIGAAVQGSGLTTNPTVRASTAFDPMLGHSSPGTTLATPLNGLQLSVTGALPSTATLQVSGGSVFRAAIRAA